MHTSLLLRVSGVTLGVFVLCLAHQASAAQVSFTLISNPTPQDGATIVEVRLDPEGQHLNVVEGVLSVEPTTPENTLSSVVVETGGSLLSLWPLRPEYSADEGVIRFTGGVPSGFSDEGHLFRLRLFTSLPGTARVSWLSGATYASDGQGVASPVGARSLVVSLVPYDSSTVSETSFDTTSPVFGAVELGQDPQAYDGKSFVSFHATDNLSGIARYEVTEGQEVTVVSDGVYVLKNQGVAPRVTIVAYDQAGNSTMFEFPPPLSVWWSVIIVVLLLLTLALLAVINAYFTKPLQS